MINITEQNKDNRDAYTVTLNGTWQLVVNGNSVSDKDAILKNMDKLQQQFMDKLVEVKKLLEEWDS